MGKGEGVGKIVGKDTLSIVWGVWGNVCCVCMYVFICIYMYIYGNLSCLDPYLSCVTDWENFCVGGLFLDWVPVPYDGCTGGRMTTMTKVAIDRLRPVISGVMVALL